MSIPRGGAMQELGGALWREIADAARGQLADAEAFYGVVAGLSGNRVQVRAFGDDPPLSGENWYARLAGVALLVGNTVLVQRTGEGTPVVVGKVGDGSAEVFVPPPAYTTGSATNNSNVNWATFFTGSFVLPTGTWHVDVSWGANAWLSVDGHVQARPVVEGVPGGQFDSFGLANSRRFLGAVHRFSGLSGTVDYALEFRPDVAGLMTIHQGSLRFTCVRTG